MVKAEKYAVGPTIDDILDALRVGYHSIDDGEGFWDGFDGHLTSLGYRHGSATPCSCPDSGAHGHMPECRWVRDWPT